MNRRYLLVVLAVCLLVGSVQAWGADFGAWNYRKEITVNNTGSNLTNYQVLFTVNRSAGSDSGFTVYLDGKCESDYDDIRFTTSDGNTLCDYWIESNSSTVANIWVEIPSIPNSTAYGSTKAYLYYGNTGASAASNGTNTFPFFDDFSGGSIDGAKWDTTGTVTIDSGAAKVGSAGAANNNIRGKSSYGEGYIARYRANIPSTAASQHGAGFCNINAGGGLDNAVGYFDMWDAHSAFVYNAVSNRASVSNSYLASYHIYEVFRKGSGYSRLDINGSTIVSNQASSYTTAKPFAARTYDAGKYLYIDWVLVRSYTATEPTVSAWGSEEEAQIVNLFPDFSGVPTSGYVPLTVYFSDSSTAENCTINTWEWSFGDSTPNSTQQDPAHTYTTSGLYNVGLTITNTSFTITNSTTKTAYINATVNLDAPNADFTVTETCGDIGDTFYFIDFSTGGGLYAWNWSFGDGSYSELRNPTHQYAGNGTYDVNLTVWGAYGVDSLLRSNLITIPCGAPTPTPTPTGTGTPTPTGTPGGNITEGNITYIYAPDQDYVPFPIWLAIVVVTIALFGHSIIFLRNSDLTAMMAAVFAFISAWLSNMIGFIEVQVTYVSEEILISPVIQAAHPPWLVYTMLLFALVSIVNIFAAIYKVYLKPTPWNEIYNRKLPKWRNR